MFRNRFYCEKKQELRKTHSNGLCHNFLHGISLCVQSNQLEALLFNLNHFNYYFSLINTKKIHIYLYVCNNWAFFLPYSHSIFSHKTCTLMLRLRLDHIFSPHLSISRRWLFFSEVYKCPFSDFYLNWCVQCIVWFTLWSASHWLALLFLSFSCFAFNRS